VGWAADNALEQGRLAGAIRADHGQQIARCHLAVEMMDRRVTVISQGEIAESQHRAHWGPIAQTTDSHKSAISVIAAASRAAADNRRIDSAAAAGGCASSGR
jgi:hypothetical protein